MPFVPERLSSRSAPRGLERAFWACVFLFTIVGMTLPMAFGYAAVTDGLVNSLINTILLVISYVLQWLLNTIGNFVLMFVDMIISVAQYNDFATAKPVEAGWPLVRDVVNMFFIVVLLVTAFSTIIQYKRFQYKQVLPKLLLMAILVNFSKTFIGLLIDLSQVIMLTFVNGFQAAAAGNFVEVLKLDKVMSLSRQGSAAFNALTDARSGIVNASENELNANLRDSFLLRIVMAEFLGMFILGLSLITLAIMLVYLIVRVVGLWIALIMSPAAFFATALDGTPLSKGVAFIAGSFWPRLGALLTGGPIMAFFLWLTLATVQTGGFLDFDTLGGAAGRQAEQAEQLSYFASTVGNAQEIATFLVGILMLLMGVEAAVSMSSQVSTTLGKAAGNIRATGLAATRFAAYGGASLAGGYVGRKMATGGGRFVERKLNLSGNVGKALQTVGNAPGLRLIPGAKGLAAKGGQLRGVRGVRAGEFKKEHEARTANMGTADKLKFFERAQKSGNKDEVSAAEEALTTLMGSKLGGKALKDRFTAEGKKSGKEGAELDAYVAKQSRVATAKQTMALKKSAEEGEDEAQLQKVGDILEKRPDMLADLADAATNPEEEQKYEKEFNDSFGKMIEQKGVDVVKKTVAPDAWQNSRTIDSVLAKTDILNADGSWNQGSDWHKKLVKGGGMRGKLFEARRDALLQRAGTAEGIKAEAAKGKPAEFYTKQGENWVGHAPEQLRAAATGDSRPAGRAVRRNAPVFQKTRVAIRNRRAALSDARSTTSLPRREESLRRAQYDGMNQGGRLAQIYAADKNGNFNPETKEADKKNLKTNTQMFMREASADVEKYQSLDTSDLHRNMNEKQEMRSAFVSASNVDQMAQAWRAAEVNNNEKTKKRVKEVVNLVHREGARVENKIATHNRTHPDRQVSLAEVSTATAAHSEEALTRATAPMGDQRIDMEEAEAIERKNQINDDPRLENLRSDASPRAAVAAGRGGAVNPQPAAQPQPPAEEEGEDEEEEEEENNNQQAANPNQAT